jgi:hypothetical protein
MQFHICSYKSYPRESGDLFNNSEFEVESLTCRLAFSTVPQWEYLKNVNLTIY